MSLPSELNDMSFQWTTEFCSSAGCLNVSKKHELLNLIVEKDNPTEVEKHDSFKLFNQCETVAKRICDTLYDNKINHDNPETRRTLQRIIEREFYGKEYPRCFVRTHSQKYTRAYFEEQNKRKQLYPGFCDSCVSIQGLWFVFDKRIKPPAFMLQHEMECKDRDACAKETMLMRALHNIQTQPFKAKIVKLPYDDQIFENSARIGTSGEEFGPCYCQIDDTNIIIHCVPDKRLSVGQVAYSHGAFVPKEMRYIKTGDTHIFTPINEVEFLNAKQIKIQMLLSSNVMIFEHPPAVVGSYTKDFVVGRIVYEGATFYANFCGKYVALVINEIKNNYGTTSQPHRIGVDTEILVLVPGCETYINAV